MITLFSYLLIGLTTGFEAIRIYAFFLAIAIIFNFFGLVTFYCPCLVLHLKRIRTNGNCLLICYKHSFRIDSLADPSAAEPAPNPVTASSSIHTSHNIQNQNHNPRQETPLLTNSESRPSSAASRFLLSSIKSAARRLHRIFSSFNTTNVNYLRCVKLKWTLFALCMAYFLFNFVITITRLKIDFPLLDLLPKPSYLHAHMQNHVNLFKLGPVIMLTFIKPMRYWENATYDRITRMAEEMKRMPGVGRLEISWLKVRTSLFFTNTLLYLKS